MLSEFYIESYKATIEINILKLEQTARTYNRTSKTPHKVTNIEDFYFGGFLGSLKYSCALDFFTKEGRGLNVDEWVQLDELFIDYQDRIGKSFYE